MFLSQSEVPPYTARVMARVKKGWQRDNTLLSRESGTIKPSAHRKITLGYPAPYQVGASSLGFQSTYRILNGFENLSCERFFAQTGDEEQLRTQTLETGSPVSRFDGIGFSVACETDLLEVVDLLVVNGLEPLARDRSEDDPVVSAGGPLTFLDPRLLSPLADIVVVGDGEFALDVLAKALGNGASKRDLCATGGGGTPGLWIPSVDTSPPPHAHASIDMLPASAVTWSPDAELRDLFLVEVARGCPRACDFCVLSVRGDCAGPFRVVPVKEILDCIPREAPGVGLVGAAVTDHPQIGQLAGEIVDLGKRVSLSSIRADRLTPDLARTLVRGGARSITLAADGSSERLRRSLHKGISAEVLQSASTIAAEAGIRGLKLYSMIGLPGEEDADLEEFARMVGGLDRRLKKSVAIQTFVPKPGTQLSAAPMLDTNTARKRLETLRRLMVGKARTVPTSARWSWLDWKLAHGKQLSAHAAIDAHQNGGTFGAWKKALARCLDG